MSFQNPNHSEFAEASVSTRYPLVNSSDRNRPNNAALHLLCGRVASGKSTLAKRLARRHNAVLISEDQCLAKVFPHGIDSLHHYLAWSQQLQLLLVPHCIELLAQGRPVVFDFPANNPRVRHWIKQLIEQADARHLLHYLTTPKQECKTRLIKRINSDNRFNGDNLLSEFDEVDRQFVPPKVEEGFNVEVNW